MSGENRLFPDFVSNLSWNVVYRGTLTAQDAGNDRFFPIPAQTYLIESSRLVAIGCKNPEALSHWYHAGWCNCIIPQQLDSAQNLPATIYARRERVPLKGYNLFIIPPWVPLPWILTFAPARWHRSLETEIYWYDGADYSIFNPPP